LQDTENVVTYTVINDEHLNVLEDLAGGRYAKVMHKSIQYITILYINIRAFTIYYVVIYIRWVMSRVMKGEAYNEHIFSIYSAYIEHILKARGRNEERARKERGKKDMRRNTA